jgi:hypothetical protein
MTPTTPLTPKQRGIIHILAGFLVPAGFFDFVPTPWNLVLGAIAAAAVAFFAFLDQSISGQQ